jgi:hypothetical protein
MEHQIPVIDFIVPVLKRQRLSLCHYATAPATADLEQGSKRWPVG